jgi:hypothetical protein
LLGDDLDELEELVESLGVTGAIDMNLVQTCISFEYKPAISCLRLTSKFPLVVQHLLVPIAKILVLPDIVDERLSGMVKLLTGSSTCPHTCRPLSCKGDRMSVNLSSRCPRTK